ncbi:hypothetical protein AC1031_000818 [Aphanomyces cochlioides]|nr:hypothetical protein AC1031_000818 [Aphanomyces cochlioides]
MPSKSKKNKTPAAAPAGGTAPPAAAAPVPPPAPPAPKEETPTASEMALRLEVLAGGKEKMSNDIKTVEEELSRLLKTPKKRVQGKSDDLDAEMKKLEFRRNTQTMTLNDEKKLLREIDNIKTQKAELIEYEAFNERVQVLKDRKKSLLDTLKLAESQEKEMLVTLRKLKLAEALNTSITSLETISIEVPKDKMGLVVGKGFAKLRQFEETYQVLLDVESGSQIVKCTSTHEKNTVFASVLDNIASASVHSVAVRPDTLKLLMIQKGKHFKALEAECFVKIDVNRAENLISFNSTADRVPVVERAIKVLTASNVTLDVPQDVLPKLIGKKGEVISKIMEDSGALLDIDRVVNTLRIIGPKESVQAAKIAVENLIHEQGVLTVDVLATDATYFGNWDANKFPVFVEYLMADKAARLRELRKEALDCRLQANKSKQLFEAIGNRSQLEALKEAIKTAVAAFQASIVTIDVDSNCLSLIIGKKGAKIKSIEQESGGARVDITGNTVSILGTKEQMAAALALVEDIVANNQRVVVQASSHLVPLLVANKRAKLVELETETKTTITLPPPGQSKKSKQQSNISITITGTTGAIEKAARLIEELNQAHQVVYIPLDKDEVTVVIGKKGETIHKLEVDTGCKLHVLDAEDATTRELELVGNEEQVANATAAIDALLNTSHRQVLTFDDIAMGVLIGRKGEQIKKLREACPGVTLDAFPHGQVRVKATSKELVDNCVSVVMDLLQTSSVQETVKLPEDSRQTFDSFYKDASIALYISELEAEGGVKAAVLEEGKQVKIRGSPLGVGKLKRFFEMLTEQHVSITIPLASSSHVASLRGSSDDTLHENVQQVMKQTTTVIRFKNDKKSYSGVVLSVEGPSMKKVLEAKQRVEVVLQFFFPKHFKLLQNVPQTSVAKIFQTLPLLSKFNVSLTLGSKDTIKIFTDSETNTEAAHKALQDTLTAHLSEYKDISVPAYIVPALVGKNGESIKRLTSQSGATLTLATGDGEDSTAPRTLTIHSKVAANIKSAEQLVQTLIETYDSECVSVNVPLDLLDMVLALKRRGPSDVSYTVEKKTSSDAAVKIHAADIVERANALERIEEIVANSTVVKIILPTADIVGALIGKSGANIKKLQSEFPGLQVDIRKDDDDRGFVSLKGDRKAVESAKAWMEEKIAQAVIQHHDFQKRQETKAAQQAQEKARAEREQAAAEASAAAPEEETKPKAKSGVFVPVGGEVKLNKNQRRRERKRAEKQDGVLSMLVGDNAQRGAAPNQYSTAAAAPATGSNGYYHSSDGYSLRL